MLYTILIVLLQILLAVILVMTTKAAVNYSGPNFAPHLIICAWQWGPASLAKGLAMPWQHRDSVGQSGRWQQHYL